MQEEVAFHLEETKEAMGNAISRLQKELTKVRTGKASPAMLNDLIVDYYGAPTPLNQVANINVADARTLVIQPWDKGALENIEKAIFAANLGVTPQNDGELIRIIIPLLTEERRRELVKAIGKLGEETRVSLRNSRRDFIDFVKKAVKQGYSEDMGKRQEENIKKIIDDFADQVKNLLDKKEEELMTV